MTPDPHDLSDAELVEATRLGDGTAFEVLYRRHSPKVRIVVASTLRRTEGVDDAVQDVFVKALEKLESLQDPNRFAPWLKSIARNVATDQLRSRPTDDIDDLPEAALVSEEVSVAELAEIRVLSGLVRGALTELSTRDIRAIALAAFAGATPPEIAEDLGISEGAARVVLHRARKRLRVGLKLELLVRRQGMLPCADLVDLVDAGATARAASHIADCETCQREGSIELRLYGTASSTAALTTTVRFTLDGAAHAVTIDRSLTVGRSEIAGVADRRIDLVDPEVSRRHLEIHVDRAQQRALALDTSTNGTLLNGTALARGVPTPLASGDRLRVGAVDLVVELGPGTPARPGIAVAGVVTGIVDTTGAVAALSALTRLHGAATWQVAADRFVARWDAEEDADAATVAATGFADTARRLFPATRWTVGG